MTPAFAAARLERIARRPDLRYRAGAVLFSRFARGGVRATPRNAAILAPHLVQRGCNRALIRRFVLQTQAVDLTGEGPEGQNPEIDFVRAVAAMSAQDFGEAVRLFGAFLSRPGVAGATVADACAVWLIDRLTPLLADGVGKRSNVNDATDLRGRVLVLAEPSSRAVDSLSSIPGETELTVISAGGRVTAGADPRVRQIESLTAAYWYTAAASRFHGELFTGARRLMDGIVGEGARRHSVDAVALHAVDVLRAEYWTFYRAREKLALETFDAVVVLGASERFRALAGLALADYKPCFIGFRHQAAPRRFDLPFWPAAAQIQRTLDSIRRSRAAMTARARLLNTQREPAPALILWAIGNPDYERALDAVLDATLSRRPVILLLRARNPASETFLSQFPKRHGGGPHTAAVAYFEDVAPDRIAQAVAKSRVIGSLMAAHRSADDAIGRLLPLAIASHRGVVGPLIAFGFGIDLVNRLADSHRLPYCVAAPGRSGMYSSIFAALRERGVPSIDTFLYTVANSVRQLSSGATHFAVVDTQQVEFCARFWRTPPERFVPVGYLAAQSGSALNAPDCGSGGAVRRIAVATQPGSDLQVTALVDIIAGLDASLPQAVTITMKPHPREPADSIRRYHDLASTSVTGRLRVNTEGTPAEVIAGADLLLTRTSNMGLEAAMSDRAVVRCPYLEADIDPRFNETPYALNAISADQAVEMVNQLIADAALRQSLAESRRAYFESNPALLHRDGAMRLIDFAEDVVTAWRPPPEPAATSWWRRWWPTQPR
ncbi:hypothetical protein [Brevundimonas sp.]|uniref:hypothetical protein n=1 Tax=Brevundimonas sp. TaxID=1871086 RepID=UPI0035AE7CD5